MSISKIYLLGDSILEHSHYVKDKYTLETKLKKEYGDDNVVMLARDNAKIKDMYGQIETLKEGMKGDEIDATVFLSIGGNDILEKIEDKTISDSTLDDIYGSHKKVVKKIKEIGVRLCILTIYKPPFMRFFNYHRYIDRWNRYIIKDYKDVVYIHEKCTKKGHFVDYIEPSSECVDGMLEQIKSIM